MAMRLENVRNIHHFPHLNCTLVDMRNGSSAQNCLRHLQEQDFLRGMRSEPHARAHWIVVCKGLTDDLTTHNLKLAVNRCFNRKYFSNIDQNKIRTWTQEECSSPLVLEAMLLALVQ